MVFGLGILRGSFSVSQKSESLLWNKKNLKSEYKETLKEKF